MQIYYRCYMMVMTASLYRYERVWYPQMSTGLFPFPPSKVIFRGFVSNERKIVTHPRPTNENVFSHFDDCYRWLLIATASPCCVCIELVVPAMLKKSVNLQKSIGKAVSNRFLLFYIQSCKIGFTEKNVFLLHVLFVMYFLYRPFV